MYRRTSLKIAALLAAFSAAGSLPAAGGGAGLPPVGSATSGGYTVAAQWHLHYEHDGKSYFRWDGNPWVAKSIRTITIKTAEVDVTEEVNKATGGLRAVIQSGGWNYQYTDFVDPGKSVNAKGSFNPSLTYRTEYDQATKTKELLVGFSLNPVIPEGKFVLLGTLACHDVRFTTKTLNYREAHADQGVYIDGSLQNGSEELIITRTERPVELALSACPHDWVPRAEDESRVMFIGRVVDPPGLPVVWRFRLTDASRHPGICNNANVEDFRELAAKWQHRIKKDSPDLLFDFRYFGKKEKDFAPVAEPWQVLTSRKPMASASVTVNCLDYGASGKLHAQGLVDGRWVTAKVRAAESDQTEDFARMPWAANGHLDNRMAVEAKTWRNEKKYFARDPDADDDDTPTGKKECRGDGLTVFDEYRGFFVRGIYEQPVFLRLDPDRKDVFVYMFAGAAQFLWQHVPDFANASGLDVHRVGSNDLMRFVDYDKHVINFNSEKPPQHGLYMTISKLPNGVLGQSLLGPPKNVVAVEFDWKRCAAVDKGGRYPNCTKATIIHELGHSVGIDHHGKGFYRTAKNELVAVEGGEYSGDEGCAMKYVNAAYYVHRSTGPLTLASLMDQPTLFPYDPKHLDNFGLVYCASARGTGPNDKSKPDWQCGDADRGNCQSQIVVNDNCPGGGGAKHSLAPSQSRADFLPTDEAERSASETQQRANLSFDLSTGRGRKTTILPGEGAIFELNLSPHAANEAAALGSAAAPWTQQIQFLMTDSDGKLVPASVKVRQAGKVARVSLSGPAPEVREEKSPQIKPGANELFAVSFAIEPSDTAKLHPGTVRIFAAVYSAGKTGAPQRVLSNSILIEIQDCATLPPGEQKLIEPRRLLSQAQLAFADERFADAENIARKVIALLSDSEEAQLLLARSLEAQGKLREAYDAYRASLTMHTPEPGFVPEPPYATMFAMRELEKKVGIERAPVVADVSMFFTHELYAETASGRSKPPFSTSVVKLAFEWKSGLPLGADPLDIRWIAADTDGVAPKDYVVSTATSEREKTSGAFTLTKPTAGFPPGKYRIEIWQGGKQIYSESFEIKP